MGINIVNRVSLKRNDYNSVCVLEKENDFQVYVEPTKENQISEIFFYDADSSRRYIENLIQYFLNTNYLNGIDYADDDKFILFASGKNFYFFGYDNSFFSKIEEIKESFFTKRFNLLENKKIREYAISENYFNSTAYFSVDEAEQRIFLALAHKNREMLAMEKSFLDKFLDFFFSLNNSKIVVEPIIYWDNDGNPHPQKYIFKNGNKVFHCPVYLFSYVMLKVEELENKNNLKLYKILKKRKK